MAMPLYLGHNNPKKKYASNKGLWFERFFDKYNRDWTIPKPQKNEESQKKKWIDEVTIGTCGETETLRSYAISQSQLCKDLGGKSQVFKNNWHFVTGMGNNHPVENGMAWHPTLGTPYLSGASVKGLLRSWMEEWSNMDKTKLKERLFFWFGSDRKDPEKQKKETQAGALIFFDALPVAPATLTCDIMTPHMDKWYCDGGEITPEKYNEALPADWHNPTPIPFLVVKKVSFQFCIAPRPQAGGSIKEAEKAMKQLKKALKYLGAGAKTAAGYGRLVVDTNENKKLDQAVKENHRKTLGPEEGFKDILTDINEKNLAEMFGKHFNKTKQRYQESGCDWDDILRILLREKRSLIEGWASADKAIAQGKAYKKIAKYLS